MQDLRLHHCSNLSHDSMEPHTITNSSNPNTNINANTATTTTSSLSSLAATAADNARQILGESASSPVITYERMDSNTYGIGLLDQKQQQQTPLKYAQNQEQARPQSVETVLLSRNNNNSRSSSNDHQQHIRSQSVTRFESKYRYASEKASNSSSSGNSSGNSNSSSINLYRDKGGGSTGTTNRRLSAGGIKNFNEHSSVRNTQGGDRLVMRGTWGTDSTSSTSSITTVIKQGSNSSAGGGSTGGKSRSRSGSSCKSNSGRRWDRPVSAGHKADLRPGSFLQYQQSANQKREAQRKVCDGGESQISVRSRVPRARRECSVDSIPQ